MRRSPSSRSRAWSTRSPRKLDIDPIEFRLKNAAKEGTHAAYGPRFGPIGLIATLEAAKAHPHYKAPLGPNQGRGVASGFWFNIGGETSVSININEDGTVTVVEGTPDIGGSRASVCLMAAEALGVEYEKVRTIIGDTSSLGFTFLTGGSRATFSNGVAVKQAADAVIKEVCARAAKIWEIPEDAVKWENGRAVPAGSNAGEFDPLSLADIAKMAGKTGGPIAGHAHLNAQGAAPSFATHLADVEVDKETGRVTVLRYTVIQDAGRAVHPAYVEGQYQGGAVQGIGWALNEEYIYGPDGRMQNAGFLDYRMPVASDLPMIDTVIIEVPNPRHPYGVRGVGETPIVPPMAAMANAVAAATGIRFTELPMSPPKVLKAIDAAKARATAQATAMNAARLARRWQDAGEDRLAMAEALVDEIDHPDTGLVSRDFLRAELQTLRTELGGLRADLIGTIWRVVLTVFGIQVVLVGVLVAILIETLARGAA